MTARAWATIIAALLLALTLPAVPAARADATGTFASAAGTPPDALLYAIFKQLVEINTTDSVGNVTTAAEAMAQRLREAGFRGRGRRRDRTGGSQEESGGAAAWHGASTGPCC